LKILITGATGYIGSSVLLSISGINRIVALARKQSKNLVKKVDKIIVGDLKNLSDNDNLYQKILSELKETQVVLHIAGLAHKYEKKQSNSLNNYRKINRNSTVFLAKMASEAGVKRFVFISTIAVYGDYSTNPLNETDSPKPLSHYAISKLEAEQGLLELSSKTAMEVVIIRPPLVYGPNAPGNFGRLTNYVKIGIPLPFGLAKNKRSFIAIDNLVDFIFLCIDTEKSPNAKNQIFLICDGEDVSTRDFLIYLSNALKKKIYLVPIPPKLIKVLFKFVRKEKMYLKLFESFQINNSKAIKLLGWEPVIKMNEQMKKITIKND
jgi:nucleoside-diphosphate-sugar epimerase